MIYIVTIFGNNASRFIVPNITNRVKKKMCEACVSFEFFFEGFDALKNIFENFYLFMKCDYS